MAPHVITLCRQTAWGDGLCLVHSHQADISAKAQQHFPCKEECAKGGSAWFPGCRHMGPKSSFSTFQRKVSLWNS